MPKHKSNELQNKKETKKKFKKSTQNRLKPIQSLKETIKQTYNTPKT